MDIELVDVGVVDGVAPTESDGVALGGAAKPQLLSAQNVQ